MYNMAKKMNQKYLSGRTVRGINCELIMHFYAYAFNIQRISSHVADIGALWKNSIGYDNNAYWFEVISNTLHIAFRFYGIRNTIIKWNGVFII